MTMMFDECLTLGVALRLRSDAIKKIFPDYMVSVNVKVACIELERKPVSI